LGAAPHLQQPRLAFLKEAPLIPKARAFPLSPLIGLAGNHRKHDTSPDRRIFHLSSRRRGCAGVFSHLL